MTRPRLLLLDEPSLGLAPMLAREIFRVIRRVNEDGVAVLLVEQNARRALALASRGYVLETGRLVTSGTSTELSADPRVRTAYLGLDRVRSDVADGRALDSMAAKAGGMWQPGLDGNDRARVETL